MKHIKKGFYLIIVLIGVLISGCLRYPMKLENKTETKYGDYEPRTGKIRVQDGENILIGKAQKIKTTTGSLYHAVLKGEQLKSLGVLFTEDKKEITGQMMGEALDQDHQKWTVTIDTNKK